VNKYLLVKNVNDTEMYDLVLEDSNKRRSVFGSFMAKDYFWYDETIKHELKKRDEVEIEITLAETDKSDEYIAKSITANDPTVSDNPQMKKLKIKAKNFNYYRLIFSSVSSTTTATVTGADVKVQYVGNVK